MLFTKEEKYRKYYIAGTTVMSFLILLYNYFYIIMPITEMLE